MRLGFNPSTQEKNWLVVIMVAGLLNGLLHVFLTPPWQHYDEPGHFEYAWLIANKPGLPSPGEFVQSMRREVAASMIEHDFFARMGFRPNLLSIIEPVWIGISQTADVPFYYLIEAIPLYLLRTSDIALQLYVGRFVSLGLFLVTLFGAYAITSELTLAGNILRLLVPVSVALIPSFVNIMTAINNDVGAAAFFTLFLWVSVRMMKRGFSPLNAGLLILLSILCIFTKSTTVFVIPLAIIAVTTSLLPKNAQVYLWISIPVLGFILFLMLVRFDGAAFWHDQISIHSVRRVQLNQSPLGEHALTLDSSKEVGASRVMQLIPGDLVQYLADKTVTIGAWIWANKPVQVRTPIIYNGVEDEFEIINAGTTPEFIVYSTKLIGKINQGLIGLETDRQPEEEDVSIYYDGIILVEGDYTSAGQPEFIDKDASHIQWGDITLQNYIRNASFELAAPRVRSNIEGFLNLYLPAKISLVISSVIDVNGYRDYFISSAQHMFRSFWAVFGWGHVYLIGSKPYRFLLIFTLIALVGDGIYLWKNRYTLSMNILGFLGLALLGVWGMAITRGVDSIFSSWFIPGARYAAPVIVPTVMIFVVGWREILNRIGRWLHIPEQYLYSTYILFLIILNLISIYSISEFYSAV